MSSMSVWGVLVMAMTFSVVPEGMSQIAAGLELKKVIPLPNVAGRIDHMDIDLSTGRIFVAALGNNTVEVVSLRDGNVLRTLKGFSEPQGVLYLPESHQLFITNGGDGSCVIMDGNSLERVKTLSGLEDADNIRYSSSEKTVYAGYGGGGIAAIDPAKGDTMYLMPLPAHPESFQLEFGGPRIYVNVPGERKIVVLDRLKHHAIAAWPVKDAESNFPMAFDHKLQRLYIGCRAPARLLILDATSGALAATVPIGKDVDDIFFDTRRHMLYVSCGEGVVDVISQQSANAYKTVAEIETRKGARTSLFVPQLNELLVAVPGNDNAGAELRVYSIAGH
jgi:DNA-binding beta-propeller fold protein YncE